MKDQLSLVSPPAQITSQSPALPDPRTSLCTSYGFSLLIDIKITCLRLELISFLLVIANQPYMFTEQPVKGDGSKAACNDEPIHTELQIAVLFLIFVLGLSDFELLVVKWVGRVSFLLGAHVVVLDIFE